MAIKLNFTFDIQKSQCLNDVFIIRPDISKDIRGNIWTSFIKNDIETLLPDNLYFKHDKFSKSKKNVLRGIHGDTKSWKLVTCVFGDIYQVVVDCREESSSFKQYESFNINETNQISVLIPPQLGNAYYVKSDKAVYHYKLAYEGDYIDADEQFSYCWNDPIFNIEWPTKNPILSKRDKN